MSTNEPTTITGVEADAIKASKPKMGRPNDPSSVAGRLRAGEVLWLPGGEEPKVSGYRTTLKPRGFRLVTRRGERDGVKGIYMWAEKVER